jgi:glycosyltransferase involved in cell wall biosynthesis
LDAPAQQVTSLSRVARLRHSLSERAPALRAAWRSIRPRLAQLAVEVAASDGTIEAAGIDVMHFTYQDAFTTHVPSIYQPWDLQHVHLPEFFSEAERRWRHVAYNTFCQQARLVVVASIWTRHDVIEAFGVNAQKIAVVGVPGVNSAHEKPTHDALLEVRRAFSLPSQFMLYPAQTWAHKNHLRLLAAIAMLRDERGIDVHLVCTGTRNAHFGRIQAEIRRLDLEPNVQFIGFVEPAQVRALYVLARAMVFPSLFEGWGLPLLEAFEAGLPVACSNVTSLPALVDHAALVFDPTDLRAMADAIARLWRDDDLGHVLSERGRRIAAGYDWDHTARMYRALYRMTAGRPLSAADVALVAECQLDLAI